METTEKQVYNHYIFEQGNGKVKLEGRYWNPGGKSIAIVACITEGIDWAAYIGTDAPDSYNEDGTLRYVADWGAKLHKADASYFFPDILLPYRC